MRGKKAKRLRREVYGDFSQREERRYIQIGQQLVNTGRRKEYLDRKRSEK